ncbi:hypothetical protein CVP04_07325 [Caviibacterium pharyngocola]|uniref:Uncharacterized protein n=1 Tax=Caviibacterium pharyngocola TaxID=28159 RepID=A0A2M8RV49_9PAST|nr:hypothetical protein CVP04_07325 [Caviibacterium pharyngocola]
MCLKISIFLTLCLVIFTLLGVIEQVFNIQILFENLKQFRLVAALLVSIILVTITFNLVDINLNTQKD